VPHKAWLQSLADLLSRFPSDQAPSSQLLADVQLVLDEAIVIAMNHGARLPSILVNPRRLDLIAKRLGQTRITELASHPVGHHDVEAMLPLIARLWEEVERFSKSSTVESG
jgi:hypothetical protein